MRREIKDSDVEMDGEIQEEGALALLLLNEVVFLNTDSVYVNCNDVFAWGLADAEWLPYLEIETLYRMWKKDEVWGPAVWCMIKRKMLPQKPVEERIRKAGIWDIDNLFPKD